MFLNVQLLPQERSENAQFNGPIYVTTGFRTKFKDHFAVAMKTMIHIWERVSIDGGADCFQVAELDGERFYIICDNTHVTFLLPSEY